MPNASVVEQIGGKLGSQHSGPGHATFANR